MESELAPLLPRMAELVMEGVVSANTVTWHASHVRAISPVVEHVSTGTRVNVPAVVMAALSFNEAYVSEPTAVLLESLDR